MSKVKYGFSFLLMLVLVGMFSAIAFAAAPTAPTGLKATVNADHTLTLQWNAVSGADTYNVKLDGNTRTDSTGLTGTTYTFNPAPEENYSIIVEAVNVDGTTPSAEFSWNADMTATKVQNDTDNDNGIVNANQTGVGVGGQSDNFLNVIKSNGQVVSNTDGTKSTSTTHRTHGEYQNNTNSCASCHQVHTGASKNLLFKNGVYATCTACHDGTLGFYNVFGTGADASKSAGTFGGSHDGNMSIHLANGAVSIKAAPGGNRASSDANWTAEFTCASCHAPHGSYSDRLLHYNPNDMGNLPKAKGGKRLEGLTVNDGATWSAATETADYALVKRSLTDTDLTLDAYKTLGLSTGDVIIELLKKTTDSKTGVVTYPRDTDPWLHGYDFDATHTNKIYWTTFNGADGKSRLNTDSITKGAIYGFGYVIIKKAQVDANTFKLGEITTVNISRGYVVKLSKTLNNALTQKTGYPMYDTNPKDLWNSKNPDGSNNLNYVTNRGVAISSFCSSCHTDYLAHSGGPTGTWNTAYRHSTDSDSYTCVRCHYAHGTDVTVMKDSQGWNIYDIAADKTGTTHYFSNLPDGAVDVDGNPITTDPNYLARLDQATQYMLDKDPSSALKRFTNMAVCWGCHTSSHSEGFRNSDSLVNGSGAGGSLDSIGLQQGN